MHPARLCGLLDSGAMRSTTISSSEVPSTVISALERNIDQLRIELVEVALDIQASASASSNDSALNAHTDSGSTFLEALDAVQMLMPFVPKTVGPRLQQMLYGMEDLYALTDGFIRTLSSSTSAPQSLNFEVTYRKTGKSIPVALPPVAHIFLATDIKRTHMELKELREEIGGA